jgi:hypothetical protein
MTPEDWLTMKADLLAVRDMNAVSVTIRRGTTTLAAQTVRVARQGTQARQAASAAGEQTVGGVVLLGATTLDVQIGDRFTLDGKLYEVTFISPNRRAATQAEAQVVE